MSDGYDDESNAHNAADARSDQSDKSKYPHLKQHTPDKQKEAWAKQCLQQNRGAYSEREYNMYEEVGTSDITIANLENRHVKKGPDCGSTGR